MPCIYSKETMLKFYEQMVRIRGFENMARDCYQKGMISGRIHLSIGQEGASAGAIAALEERDFITTTHRGHGHCIARGAKTDKMLAEIFGKKTGYCGGKGGSMHIADKRLGILGANGIVGAGIPIATGSALVSKIKGTDEVTLCIFGDAASNQGTFHESINMAASMNLPVVYFIENNRYGISVCIDNVINTDDIYVRSQAYGIPGYKVEGRDPAEVYEAVKRAVDHARNGKGPVLVECGVYRWDGHYSGDPSEYRPPCYLNEALSNDPVNFFEKRLIREGIASKCDLEKIVHMVHNELNDALKFAQESGYPDVSEAVSEMYSADNKRCVMR